jgi:hypothetical protein
MYHDHCDLKFGEALLILQIAVNREQNVKLVGGKSQ